MSRFSVLIASGLMFTLLGVSATHLTGQDGAAEQANAVKDKIGTTASEERINESNVDQQDRESRIRKVAVGEQEEEIVFRGGVFEQEEEFDEFEVSEDQLTLAAWIGVEIGPLDAAVTAHLPAEFANALMVYDVLEQSPAAVAGLQQYDLVLSVAGQKVSDFGQLRQQVERAKDGELSVEILRKGTKTVVQLKPGTRPWNPDVFMPGSVDIPGDVEVTLNRKGNGPISVVIQQGDQSWHASTDEEFEELPVKVVMWLFDAMNEFMPADEEEEWTGNWDDEEPFERMEDGDDEGGFGIHRFFQDEEYDDSDPFEQRIDGLERKLDRVLRHLEKN